MKTTPSQPLTYPKTPKTAKAWFRRHGICVAYWADELGLSRWAVKDALRGKNKGNRGAAHNAAVALGLKPNPEESK